MSQEIQRAGRVSGEREFDEWVCRRLANWPTTQILDFEQWLQHRNAVEFMPALHEALRRRSDEPEQGLFRTSKEPVDELVLRLKKLVHARAALEDDRASMVEIEAHTIEIERLRAQLARSSGSPPPNVTLCGLVTRAT